ncbi:MAG: ribonuclease HII [Candidatus Saccharibacteria bacterium]
MLIGIDEVGRGCLAGPLVIGAVSLDIPLKGLKDSKLVSAKNREILAKEIYVFADYSALGWVWPHEIDELGLTKATTLAIKRALVGVDHSSVEILIDGNYNYLPGVNNVKTLINADDTIPSVSAASIIAKVARDNYMKAMAEYCQDYGFTSHVGYGTKEHLIKLKILGPSPLHRLSVNLPA